MIKFKHIAITLGVLHILSDSLGSVQAQEITQIHVGNFGLPGLVDLPTAQTLPDGELIITQQLHESLARTGASFQLLPNLGVSFRYSGHGKNGTEANGRVNHDRSFDAHLTLLREGTYHPGIAVGLRDFIGTGWYSSEYFVATKSVGNFEFTGGLGFGRLAGRHSFENPFAFLGGNFTTRERNRRSGDRGGTLGNINWFQGNAAVFGGVAYHLGEQTTLVAEYTSDSMQRESSYSEIKTPWNVGATYRVNDTLSLAAQYLHGSTVSVTANIALNPKRPPNDAGRETAPVPMRIRGGGARRVMRTDEATIRKVFAVEGFEIISMKDRGNYIRLDLKNEQYRSTAQALGRAAATLQRFTSDATKSAVITFHEKGLQAASYTIDLERVTDAQFGVETAQKSIISAQDVEILRSSDLSGNKINWNLGPYITHRLFNPDLPLSAELGAELSAKYEFTPRLSIDGALRKSILTNLTENNRAGHGKSRGIPRTQSDWGLYDIHGQGGHIHRLSFNYYDTVAPAMFARAHVGLLEPFWAGLGGEVLYMPVNSPFALGFDVHRVRKRDYEMRFEMQNYQITTGHVSAYFDAGRMFDLEINAGRYLAGDWGVTTRVSRQFANGWEVGGYATITDVPFSDFGEGSFDKGIYLRVPMDWLTGNPDRSRRYFEIRPITKDGGARLGTARSLYRTLKNARDTQLNREIGRIWK